MEHYVTLFDSLFLPQGLALHMSMERHAGAYTLWILCVDHATFNILKKMSLPNVRLIALDTVETKELRSTKANRSRGEYCWTLTPFSPSFVFDADSSVLRVTYIDADVWLRKKPDAIFKEFTASGKHVLITDHAYAAEYDQSAKSGQYCVQFMTFTRTSSEPVLKWWQEQCIEWCFARFEEGRFGDQKYLDDWPDRFPEHVHVLKDKELALAPWNATRFPFGNAVLWHFHGLRLLARHKNSFRVELGTYRLPSCTRQFIYEPYLNDLRTAISCLHEYGFTVQPQKASSWLARTKFWFRDVYQRQRRMQSL
jgi:hypothetical protein